MNRSLTSRFWSTPKLIGLAVVAVALAVQLALGAVGPKPELAQTRTAALEAALVLCHADLPGDTPRDKPFRHGTDCPVCPLCQALQHSAIVLSSAPDLMPPVPLATGRSSRPFAARAPPPGLPLAASPRGPPISI